MKKATKEYKLAVVGGDRYPSLEGLQADLLEPLAEALAAVIRRKAAKGERVVPEGKVVPRE